MLEELKAAADIVSNLSVAGVLLFAVWAFYRGRIFSKDTVDLIVKGIVTSLTAALYTTVRDAVKDGMMEAHYEINGGKQSESP